MNKRKKLFKKATPRTKKSLASQFVISKTFIFASVSVFLFLALVYNSWPTSFSKNNNLSDKQYVLGDDDSKEEAEKAAEDEKKEMEKAKEEQQKIEERSKEESQRETTNSNSQNVTGTEKLKSIRVKTENESTKSETEIETADGQKIKTKVEDDGTTKIEFEHKNLKIKYEMKNGQVVKKAEDADGNEVELEDEDLHELENEIETELADDGIKIATTGAGLMTFAKNNIAAINSFPLSIDIGTNQLIVTTPNGQKVVAVLPDQAVQNLIDTGIITTLNSALTLETPVQNPFERVRGVVEFKMRDGEAVYEINGSKIYPLFGLIPVSRPVKAIVSTETGESTVIEASLLTNLVDFFSP